MVSSIMEHQKHLPFLPKGIKRLDAYETQLLTNVVQPENISDRLDSIGGLSKLKKDIESNVLIPLKYPKIFFSTKSLSPPRGILLYGPPGTGKTMIAKAVAKESSVPFLSLTLSSLENKYFGESSKLLSATFSLAKKLQPSVLFFDEIDGMIRKRSDMDQSCVYGFKTEFLTHMDGISTGNEAVIIIGCTNCVDSLDAAVKRRLSKHYKVDFPNAKEKLEILKLNVDSLSNENLQHLSESLSATCSGSDIVNAIQTAQNTHLQRKIGQVKMTLENENTTSQDIEKLVGTVDFDCILQVFASMNLLNYVFDDEEAPP